MGGTNPFTDPGIAGGYEEWLTTAYGRVAAEIELAMLRDLLGPPDSLGSVCDVGCGTGHFASGLTAAGYRVVGLDPSLAMLDRARTRIPVVCGSGGRLPFRDRAFGAVVLTFVLEFSDRPLELLGEARRVARERVVVLTLNSRSWLGLRRRLAGRLGNPIFAQLRLRSRAELLDLARRAAGEPLAARGALYLPPRVAGWLPALERGGAGRSLPASGVLGLALAGADAAP